MSLRSEGAAVGRRRMPNGFGGIGKQAIPSQAPGTNVPI
jgi:hypothetical protein